MNDSLSDAASVIQKNFVAGHTSRYIAEMLAADGLLRDQGHEMDAKSEIVVFPRIPTNPKTAAAIKGILGLPHDRWAPISITVDEDGARAAIEILLTGEELTALTAMACEHGTGTLKT